MEMKFMSLSDKTFNFNTALHHMYRGKVIYNDDFKIHLKLKNTETDISSGENYTLSNNPIKR